MSNKMYQSYEYTTNCGVLFEGLQGYERHFLEVGDFPASELISDRQLVPEVWYLRDDKSRHRYYMDFFHAPSKTCIEVKSTFTYSKDKYKVELTKKACEDLGLSYRLYVFDDKGKKRVYVEL